MVVGFGAPYACFVPTPPVRWTRVAFLLLVASLPLHTVFVRAGIALKLWLLLLVVVVAFDLIQEDSLPWSRRAFLGVAALLLAGLISWPGLDADPQFWRLWLALGAGGLLMLTVGRHAIAMDSLLRTVFWSGAILGATALVAAVFTNGAFGEEAVTALNDLPLVDRVNKRAYLDSGFLALTNWHQDPGYAALWTNSWLALSTFAWTRGMVRAPSYVGPLVLGALMTASILTYSRTGWLGLLLAIGAVLVAHWRSEDLDLRRAATVLAGAVVAATVIVGALVILDEPGVGGDIETAIDFRFSYLGDLGAIDLGEEGQVNPDLVVDDNRLAVWAEYSDRFLDNPIRGIGLGAGWAEPGLQEPHNMWLELTGEMGLVGLVGFLFLLYTLGRPRGPETWTLVVIVGAAGLSQTVLFEPILWFALGIWLASSQTQRRLDAALEDSQESVVRGR